MNKTNSIYRNQTVLEIFEKIEKELKLDEALIKGVPWWDSVRYPLYLKLLNELNLRNEKISEKNFFSKIVSITIKFFKQIYFLLSPKSPIWIKKKSTLIFGHPRRKLENGNFIDIYSDPFIDLMESELDFSLIENNINGLHLSPTKTKKIFYNDPLMTLGLFISLFRKVNFSSEEFLVVSKLEKLLNYNFKSKIDIKKLVKKKVKEWLGIFPVMKFFFKLKKPKLFFIVSSVFHEPVIAAAKSTGVATVEIQHGSPTRGKLNYDYTSGIKKKSFPDFFLSFGEFWTSDILLPINKNKIINFGFPYLQNKISLHKNIVKENRIVVVSQLYNSKKLANFATKIYKKFDGKVIVEFKPHPLEYFDEPDHFKELQNQGILVSDKNRDLYRIFAQSKWQVGVCSTALYEGLCFGTACFILKLPGYELMQKLIDLKFARLIYSEDDIDLNYKFEKTESKKIFTKTDKKKLNFFLNNNF